MWDMCSKKKMIPGETKGDAATILMVIAIIDSSSAWVPAIVQSINVGPKKIARRLRKKKHHGFKVS